jgi:hypothetical protein
MHVKRAWANFLGLKGSSLASQAMTGVTIPPAIPAVTANKTITSSLTKDPHPEKERS